MATRGAIARRVMKQDETEHFRGVYHHWDSYPSGLGKTLYELYHGHFQRDLPAMLRFLIDEHPAGWSTINQADFSLPAPAGPVCYCHGSRAEEANEITDKNAGGCGVEYVYSFDEDARRMHVLSSYCKDGQKMVGFFGAGDPDSRWGVIKTVNLDDPEPDWDALDTRAYAAAGT